MSVETQIESAHEVEASHSPGVARPGQEAETRLDSNTSPVTQHVYDGLCRHGAPGPCRCAA